MAFQHDLQSLIRQLDARRHGDEITRLRSCRTAGDLEALARDGWLSPSTTEPRLKLVRHGSGTYLVVQYDKNGWSTRVAQQPFPR